MATDTPTRPLTQQQRIELITRALWFSAVRYVPVENQLLACIEIDQTANILLAMLDDMEQLKELPVS